MSHIYGLDLDPYEAQEQDEKLMMTIMAFGFHDDDLHIASQSVLQGI